MTTTDTIQIKEIAAELYEANRDNFIADIASTVAARFESGLSQLANGETMDFDSFKRKANDIEF